MRRAEAMLLLSMSLQAACEARTAAPSRAASAPAPPTKKAVGPAVPSLPPALPEFSHCGPLDCRQYASPKEAFLAALEANPLVVGVGEAHAPRGATVRSAAARFADDILPALAGRASDLLLELMMAPRGCADAASEVREKQRPVAEMQAEQAQDDYVAMGNKARSIGIVPDLLRPSCADLDAVRAAGEGAVTASLALIANLTRVQARPLADRNARSDTDRAKAVVIYGGLLHNKLVASAESLAFSYAPDLDVQTQRRFVAVDLIVPEFIGDDATWRSLRWWAYYDRAKMGAKTTLFVTGERSYVLVFAAGD